MVPMKSVLEANITAGQRVLVRCDLDVPVAHREIKEEYRLKASLETLKYIISRGALPVIMGHVGSPGGRADERLSTKPLSFFFDNELGTGKYELLENLRFNRGEEENNLQYAKQLSTNGTIYVNESFATSHRKHASIVGVPEWLPSYAGVRFLKEIENLNVLLGDVKRLFVIVIGGAKLESKLPVVKKFLKRADFILLGGKLGMEWKEEIPFNLVIPKDYAPENKDIGSQTIAEYTEIINRAGTILWAGPLGAYEQPEYSLGTAQIASAIAKKTKEGTFTVIGGGDTITAVSSYSLLDKFSFVSTGGGAMLQYLAEKTLPGIEALNKRR